MNNWSRPLRIGGAIAGGLVAAGVAATAVGTYAWRRTTARRFALLADQMRVRGDSAAQPFSPDALDRLPAPVARYLRFALPNGQRRIRAARIRWEGEMRLRPNAAWSPYSAEQHFTIAPPGFVWDAEFRMVPLVPVRRWWLAPWWFCSRRSGCS